MVDRTQAESVGNRRLARLVGVANDVRRVEQSRLLKPANSALIRIGREHATAEARLVEPNASLANGVVALDRLGGKDPVAFVVRADHASGRQQHHPLFRTIFGDEHGPLRPIPAGSRAHEVDNRHLQRVRRP